MNPKRLLLAVACAALMTGLAAPLPAVAQGNPTDGIILPPRSQGNTEPRQEVIKVPDWRERARDMIARLSEFANARSPSVTVLMRGAPDLLFRTQVDDSLEALLAPPESLSGSFGTGGASTTDDGLPVGALERQFARVLDGVVIDDIYCRDTGEEAPPPPLEPEQVERLLDFGLTIITIERCNDAVSAQQARTRAAEDGILAHVTTDRRLASVPAGRLAGASAEMVQDIAAAENVLVVLDSSRYDSLGDWLEALRGTNHDALIITPFFHGDEPLTPEQVYGLKFKKVGVPRLVIARLPMTIAYDTAWYWKPTWKVGSPAFITGRTDQEGVYRVDFAHTQWREIVGESFRGLLELGFDGVMLDGLDIVQTLTEDGPVN